MVFISKFLRAYKAALPRDAAFQMILDGQCGEFNGDLIDCFKKSYEHFCAEQKA